MHSAAVTGQDAARRITDIFVFAMLLLFPLYTGLHGYSAILQAKLRFYLCASALWALGLLVCRLRCGPLRGRPFGRADRAILAFLGWCCLSALFSPFSPAQTLWSAGRYDGLVTALLYGLTALGISRWGSFRPGHVYAFAVSAVLCCVVALLQLAGGNPLELYPNGWRFADAGTLYSGAYLGTVGNTLILSSVLSPVTALLIAAALLKRGRSLLLLLPVPLLIYVLWRGGGSSAAAALIGCAGLVLPAAFPRSQRCRVIAAELVLCIALLIYVFFYHGGSVTLQEFSRLLHGQPDDSMGSSRIRIWREALALFPARPLLGGGPGTMAERLHVEFSRFVETTGQTLTTRAANAHNEYIGYLINTGLGGFLLYLRAMVLSLAEARTGLPRALPLAAAVLSCWLQGFFALGLVVSAPLLWVLWGLLISCRGADPIPPEGGDNNEKPPARQAPRVPPA